jgi:transcriptional regulator of acetoin/glycerol metabolism
MNDDWSSVCAILRAEAPDQAERIEARLLHELGGLRLTVPRRVTISRAEAHKLVRANKGDVRKAAKQAGLSLSSMYRRIQPEPRRQDHGPRMGGRMVR